LQDTSGKVTYANSTVTVYGYTNPNNSQNKYIELSNYPPSTQQCGVVQLPVATDCKQVYSTSAQLGWLNTYDATQSTAPSCSISSPTVGTVIRTYNGSGCLGGQQVDPSTPTQTITIIDTLPPVITVTNYTWSSCILPTTWLDFTVTDGCQSTPFGAAPTVSFVDVIVWQNSGACPANKSLQIWQRRITAVDKCGNTAYAVQTITVEDITVPSFSCPPSCSCANRDNSTATWCLCGEPMNVSDDCGMSSDRPVYATYNDGTYGCPWNGRELTVVDNCGNIAEQVFTK